MRNFHPLLLVVVIVSLAASCAFLTRTYRPPHAPKSEAEKVKFPWGSPRESVTLSGVWLRAVTMALDDFMPAEEAERTPVSEFDDCLARRENYFVDAWVWSPRGASDGGADVGPDLDGGSTPELDAGDGGPVLELDAGNGNDDPWAPPGMPKAPPLIYVTVGLIGGRCELQGSPILDMGAVYAIDTVNWRILAIHH